MQGYVTRKNDHWYAVIYDGLDPATGKERRRWHPAGTDRAEAEDLANRLAEEARDRRGTGRSRLTLAGHVQRTWLPRKTRQLQPVTLDGYERQLRLYLLPALGHVALRSLRVEPIEALYEQLLTDGRADGTGGLSTKSVLEVHMLLRQLLDDAVTRGLIIANPARQAVPPRYRRMAPTPDGMDRARTQHLPRRRHRHRHHRTWWLAARTGMRRSELVGLRWRDIDLERKRLSVTRAIVAVNGRMQLSNGKTTNSHEPSASKTPPSASSSAGDTTTPTGSAVPTPSAASSSATTVHRSTRGCPGRR